MVIHDVVVWVRDRHQAQGLFAGFDRFALVPPEALANGPRSDGLVPRKVTEQEFAQGVRALFELAEERFGSIV